MKKMTRIAAFLLCVILGLGTAAGALADQGWNMDITYRADAAEVEKLFGDLAAELGDAASMGAAFAEMINSLHVTGSGDASGMSAAVSIGDTALADLALRFADGRYQFASNLLPATVVDVTDTLTTAAQSLGQNANLSAALAASAAEQSEQIAADVTAWMGGLQATSDYGIFTGDAYTGGVLRSTMNLTDRDVALLGIMLINRLDGTAAAAEAGLDWNEIKSNLTARLTDMGARNTGRYTVSTVSNDAGRPVGLSVTVYRENEQVATLSVGFDGEMNVNAAVVSFGSGDQVYIVDWNGTIVRDGVSSVTATGELRVWLDPTRQGFRVASADSANLQGTMVVNSFSYTAGETVTLSYDVTLAMPGRKNFRETYTCTVGDTIRAESAIYYDGSSTALITAASVMTPGEVTPYAWPEGAALDPVENAEQLQQIFATGQTALIARLLVVLPMELKMLILNSVGI